MRKNFKARMTAKNMNITEYNKETLIRLMIFASQIGELNSNEAKRTIDLSRKWEITNLSEINSVRSLKRLKETAPHFLHPHLLQLSKSKNKLYICTL